MPRVLATLLLSQDRSAGDSQFLKSWMFRCTIPKPLTTRFATLTMVSSLTLSGHRTEEEAALVTASVLLGLEVVSFSLEPHMQGPATKTFALCTATVERRLCVIRVTVEPQTSLGTGTRSLGLEHAVQLDVE